MRLLFARPLLRLPHGFGALVLAAALAGCGVIYTGDDPVNGADGTNVIVVTNPATYPPGTVVFTVDVTTQFQGESVDVRVDGQRIFRKPLTTPAGAARTDRIYFAVQPGLRLLYVRVGNDQFNVNTSQPVQIGDQTCATISFVRNFTVPQQSRVNLSTSATCAAS